MLRNPLLYSALFAAAAAVSPASAQSWGWGVETGGPAYYGAPPAYYAPGYYPRARPISPDAVFNALEAAGYREFGPMAPREPIYQLNAVNPRGDLVALDVSMFTGEIERERILAVHQGRRFAPTGRRPRRGPPPLRPRRRLRQPARSPRRLLIGACAGRGERNMNDGFRFGSAGDR